MPGPSARLSFPHRTLSSDLRPGATVAAGTTVTARMPCAGATVIRIRAKLSGVATTLKAAFLQPDGKTPYATNNPADVPLVAGTENKMDITVRGEGMLQISIVGDASDDATINFVDVMGLSTT